MKHIKKWNTINEATNKDYEIWESFQGVSEGFDMVDEGLSLVLDFLKELKKIKGVDKYNTDVKKIEESITEIRQKFEKEFDSKYEEPE
jgi:hypothetical protein